MAQMGREMDKGEKTWFMTTWEYYDLPFGNKIGKLFQKGSDNAAGADKTDEEKAKDNGITSDPTKSWDDVMVADVSAVAAALPATRLPPSRCV